MFEDRLKRLRLARGLSQQETADALGLKVNTYRNYENNDREPNSTVLIKLGKYFGVTLDYLLDYHCDKQHENIKTQNNFTNKEEQYIKKYRTLDEHGKQAIDNLLDVEYNRCAAGENKENTVKMFKVARSSDNEEPQIVELTQEQFDRIVNAPEIKDKF